MDEVQHQHHQVHTPYASPGSEREFFIDNLLVRIHVIIEMILVDRPTLIPKPYTRCLTNVLLIFGSGTGVPHLRGNAFSKDPYRGPQS